jgi:hypothetical protein
VKIFYWVSSFPRSGNRLLSEIIHLLVSDRGKFRETVPDYHQNQVIRSSFCKIHSLYENLPDLNCRIIYLIRNPFDLLLSSINYLQNFQKVLLKPSFASDFSHQQGYINEWKEFGSYYKHVSSFLLNEKLKSENLLIVQYENLVFKKSNEIKRIADFINIPVTESKILNIQKKTSFSNVKSKEPNNVLLKNGGVNQPSNLLNSQEKDQVLRFYNELIGKVNSFRLVKMENNL